MAKWNSCPNCGITVNSMADYCPNCGEPWTIECANCGLRWRFWKNYKFCPSCGTLAEKPGVGGKKERKVVPNIGKPKI